MGTNMGNIKRYHNHFVRQISKYFTLVTAVIYSFNLLKISRKHTRFTNGLIIKLGTFCIIRGEAKEFYLNNTKVLNMIR